MRGVTVMSRSGLGFFGGLDKVMDAGMIGELIMFAFATLWLVCVYMTI